MMPSYSGNPGNPSVGGDLILMLQTKPT